MSSLRQKISDAFAACFILSFAGPDDTNEFKIPVWFIVLIIILFTLS